MLKTFALVVSAVALGASAAWADVTKNATVQPGKVARLHVVTAFNNDCSLGSVGSIRIINAPKNGSAVLRGGKLKTPGTFRCPNKETPVQALFYSPNKNFQGSDEVSFETKSTDGATETYVIKINVTSKPSGSGLQDL